MEEAHFLQQIAVAEDRLHDLERACGEMAGSLGDAPYLSRSESATGAIPSNGYGMNPRGTHSQYSPPVGMAHIFSNGSLSE
jgi:hypothetical protein